MSKFHISTKTNKPERCRDQSGKCPYAGVSEHYGSIEEAQKVNEEKMSKEYNISTSTLSPKYQKEVNHVLSIVDNAENFQDWDKLDGKQVKLLAHESIVHMNENNYKNVLTVFEKLAEHDNAFEAKNYIHNLYTERPHATKNLSQEEKQEAYKRTVNVLEIYNEKFSKKKKKRR